jgi:hypothetical protein
MGNTAVSKKFYIICCEIKPIWRIDGIILLYLMTTGTGKDLRGRRTMPALGEHFCQRVFFCVIVDATGIELRSLRRFSQ